MYSRPDWRNNMADKYIVGELTKDERDIVIEGYSDAQDWTEEYTGQFDEQIFMGVWLQESGNLMAIYDGMEWFTK